MKLNDIVPWGRNMGEYAAMFSLSRSDIARRILGCGDGPAGFNAEWTQAGGSVVSVDPVYAFSGADIARRFEEAAPDIMQQVESTVGNWIWSHHVDPPALLASRRASLEAFLQDYAPGAAQGRYITASLPSLPFPDGSFDLALCSHLLFLYSDLLDEAFHIDAVRELCRVAGEVRIFPLITLSGQPSPHLNPVMQALADAGVEAEIVPVPYEFQPGGSQMLRLRNLPVPAPSEGHPQASAH